MSEYQEYQQLWNNTRDELQSVLREAVFEENFGETTKVVKADKGIIYVLVPSTYVKNKINTIYSKQIADIVSRITTKKVKFKFVEEAEVPKPKVNTITKINKVNLNEAYTFESFVVGESNRLSYITAMKVADEPGTFANPLYIFGGVGLGKTHLMQAIGNYIYEQDLDKNILYVQASDYIDDYAKAARDNTMEEFEAKYGNLDVLLIDDIQMLETGKKSQQEFFKLFNVMSSNNKQIVITSDCLASKLNGIMDRLTSRFEKGITVNIKQPDKNQRINILKRKLAEHSTIDVPDNVLDYIAENFTNNVRELEGALTRVLWVCEAYNNEPSLALAEEALEFLIRGKKPTLNQNYEAALSVVADVYGISLSDLYGKSRNSKYVLPRHIAMYILKNHYNLTYSKIGSILNGRDHTTIMNGCNKIEEEIKVDSQLKMAIDLILKKV